MDAQKPSLEVLLLGSSPLESAEAFLTTTSDALGKRLHQIPDGETGARCNFIFWQNASFPPEIVRSDWDGQYSAERPAKNYTLDDIKPTNYDTEAIASYAVFRKLKESGRIAPNVRFQVCLPTPLCVITGVVPDRSIGAQVEPLYEERLMQAIRNMQEQIPASELTIQWDLPVEVLALEYEVGRIRDEFWKAYTSPAIDEILSRLVRHAKVVAPDIEMGYHLCYGDVGHEHIVQPVDTRLMVDLTNAISEQVGAVHRIAFFHIPVPRNRKDAEYFLPLKDLNLRGAKLFLGLVRENDEAGTRERLEVARRVYPGFAGVGSECGLGRTPKEDVGSVLEICASL